ncbi:MAG: bifunctional methionine sulfoxide reductase B/A protein [Phycisphaerales bacterium]
MRRLLGLLLALPLAVVLAVGSFAQPEEKPMKTTPAYSKSAYDITPLDANRVEALATKLTPEDRQVVLAKGTERPFCGNLLDNKKDGVYVCKLCGLPLFRSDAKFQSGTGWPSFFQPYDSEHVRTISDRSHGMERVEILCARCPAHLGHVFDDGPEPTGLRFCVNSASLDFIEQKADGALDLPPASRPIRTETAYFGGGCFWGVEDRFQQVAGVVDAASGYQGGKIDNPTYREVCNGDSGHAEVVRVVFDPARVSYRDLLAWFFKFHDPTQLNRQGPDFGEQYRSAIFTADDKHLELARAFIAEQQATERFKSRKIVTEVRPADRFYLAEDYHQDYHLKNGGSCPLPANP